MAATNEMQGSERRRKPLWWPPAPNRCPKCGVTVGTRKESR